jgi:hypothetical protein
MNSECRTPVVPPDTQEASSPPATSPRTLAQRPKRRKTAHDAPRAYAQSGINTARRAFRWRGLDAIDKRSSGAQAILRWRRELIRDLGGEENLSAMQLSIVELAARAAVLLEMADSWILQYGSVVNKRNRCLLPIVRERMQLSDGLARYLQALGLERRKPPAIDLDTYLATRVKPDSPKESKRSIERFRLPARERRRGEGGKIPEASCGPSLIPGGCNPRQSS